MYVDIRSFVYGTFLIRLLDGKTRYPMSSVLFRLEHCPTMRKFQRAQLFVAAVVSDWKFLVILGLFSSLEAKFCHFVDQETYRKHVDGRQDSGDPAVSSCALADFSLCAAIVAPA